MKKTIVKALALCLTTSMVAGVAMAADADNVFTLGEIVVQDNSGVQDIAAHNTVTAEEIENIGATNAAEALKFVPGINVVQTTKGTLEVTMLGFKQRDIMVLIDGVPYYETKEGPLDLQQIPSAIIGKIEVIKGASSVLYGPNALGGVINIITKKGVEGFNGVVSAEGGLGGYARSSATLNYGAENGFSVLGTIDYKRRDSLRFSDDYKPNSSVIGGGGGPIPGKQPVGYEVFGKKKMEKYILDNGGKKDNSDLESLNLWTRLGYAPTEEAEIYASLYHYDMERGRPFSDNHNRNIKEVTDDQDSHYGAAWTSFGRYDEYKDMGIDLGSRVNVNDWLSLRAMAFYHHHRDSTSFYENWDLKKKLGISSWRDESYGVSLFSDMDLNQFGMLGLTAQYRKDEHKDQNNTSEYTDHQPFTEWRYSESNTITFAAEDTIKFGQFTTVLGLAYHRFEAEKIDENPDAGYDHDTFDPMLGLTWTAENGMELFGSVAQKTRFPTFSDMEENNIIYAVSPETSINYTLGARHTFFDMTTISMSGFYNDVKDRIDKKEINEDLTIMENIDEVEIYGVEFVSNTDLTDRLSLGLNYVYTHARDMSPNEGDSNLIEDIPEHAVNADVSYMIPNIETRFTVRGTYKDGVVINAKDETFEDSLVFDLSLIKEWDNGFTLGGYIYNLFDANYYEGDGMASNGFNCKVVASYEF